MVAEPTYWDSLARADRVVVATVQDLRANRSLKVRARCWVRQAFAPTHDAVVRLGHRIDRGFGLLAEEHWPKDSSCFIPRDLYARLRVEVNLKGEGTPWPRVKMSEGGETFLVPGERLVVLLRGDGLRWWPVGAYRSALLARDAGELAEVVSWVREGLAHQAAGAETPPVSWRLRALTLPTLSPERLPELNATELELLARLVADQQILGDSLAIAIERLRYLPNPGGDVLLAQLLEAELASAKNPMLAKNMMAALLARIGAKELYTELAAKQFSSIAMEDSQARWSEAKRLLGIEPVQDLELLRRHHALRAWKQSLTPRWRQATAEAERYLW